MQVSLGTRMCITSRQAAGSRQAGRLIRIRSREAFSRTFPCRKNAAVYCQAARLAGGNSTVSCSNIFDLLGLPRSSTVEEMRHAYRLRAKELHPDQNKQDGAADEFQHLQKLFKVGNRYSLQPCVQCYLCTVPMPVRTTILQSRRLPQCPENPK